MPSTLSTWVARANHHPLDIHRGDAVTALVLPDAVEVTVHRLIPCTLRELLALERSGVLRAIALGPSIAAPSPSRPVRVLPFGVLRDRRRSTAQRG